MKKILLLLIISVFFLTGNTQDFATKQLEESSRHHEWVKIKVGEREVSSIVVYPEVAEKALSVIVIHENRGLNTWARSFADQLAAKGFLVIAPDLISGYSEEFKKTTDYPTSDAAREAIYNLDPEKVTADLNAVQEYITKVPASNGKSAVIGFCWGGSQSFRLATTNSQLEAALVFYGSPPTELSEIEKITAPVYGFYGGNDNRINATIPETEKQMKQAGKLYKYEIYEGAGHAYMRNGDNPNGEEANITARNKSWERLVKILKGL